MRDYLMHYPECDCGHCPLSPNMNHPTFTLAEMTAVIATLLIDHGYSSGLKTVVRAVDMAALAIHVTRGEDAENTNADKTELVFRTERHTMTKLVRDLAGQIEAGRERLPLSVGQQIGQALR